MKPAARWFFTAVMAFCPTFALCQSPQPDAQAPAFRVSTTLVQVDAVVTDSKGRHVADLRPEDFELRQDGHPQRITHFSYVSTPVRIQPVKPGRNAPPPPPVHLRPEQVRRSIALVVDDLGLSFESMHHVRRALAKFVDEQMGPADLAAIIRTSAGMGALQQFTADRRQLHAAIDRIVWSPYGRQTLKFLNAPEADSRTGKPNPGEARYVEAVNRAESGREDIFSVGTLGTIRFVVRGLKELPGRKAVVLLSEGLRIKARDGSINHMLENLRALVEQANRASVVIYTLDARGLVSLAMPGADESDVPRSGPGFARMMEKRRADFSESLAGLNYLADETGGLAKYNDNDLGKALEEIVDDQTGYYLIGYSPKSGTFEPDRGRTPYHRIGLKVKGPGLRLRSRNGFFGIPDEEVRPAAPRSRDAQLLAALTSPFAAPGVRLRLTSLYANDAKQGAVLYSLLHMNGRDFTFEDEADGWKKAVIDVWVSTFGDNGAEVNRTYHTYTLRARGEDFQRAVETGLVYMVHHPVKKPGAYQLRVAVRDAASEKVGSANQLVDVPDLKNGRLALSGIVMRAADGKLAPAEMDREGRMDTPDPMSGPALRIFKPGKTAVYAVDVLNARRNAAKKPEVVTQMRLFRDGTEVYAGAWQPPVEAQLEPLRLFSGGYVSFGGDMPPGNYVLQVIATDGLAKEKYRSATQWIDFEVRN